MENIDEDNLKSRIDNLCENIFEVNYHNDKISFTISVGFVIHPDQGRGYHDLFRKADMALGDAKKKGKGMGLQFNEQ